VFPETQPTFFGLRKQEAEGLAAQVLRMGLQWEVRQDRFLTLMANGGGAGRTWGAISDDSRFGWALGAGAPTMVGPIALTVSGGSGPGHTRVSFSLGRQF